MSFATDEGRHIVSVLGMHRCGIFLTARLINQLGVDLGPEEDHLEPRFDNLQGYSEQRPIMELNDAILDALGGSWWRPPEMPAGWERRPEVEALVPSAREILAAQFGESNGSLGWDDPRTSLTLPFWRKVVPQARYIVCLRNPMDVASSLLLREPNTHTWDSAIALWLRYTAEALENTEGEERLLLFYEDYFGDTERQLSRIAHFVGCDHYEVSKNVRDKAESVIQPGLRRHRTSAVATIDTETLPPEVGAFFLAVRAAHVASTIRPGEDGSPIDKLEPGLFEATTALGSRLCPGQAERKTVAAVERDVVPAVTAAEREGQEGIAAARHYAETAIAAAERERHEARRAEREHRIALDRALVELEGTTREADGTQGRGDEYLEGELEGKERALVRALADLAHQREALARAQADLADQRAALAGISGSVSWKVTAPLRSGKRMWLGSRR